MLGFPGAGGGGGGGGGGGSGLVVAASPDTLNKHGFFPTLTTANTVATASGGTSPYSYAWTVPPGLNISATAPTSATTGFTATNLAPGNVVTATATITVTDHVGATATDTVSLSFERTA